MDVTWIRLQPKPAMGKRWVGVTAAMLLGLGVAGEGAWASTYPEFRRQAFRAVDGADEAVSGKAADPDGDGRVNFAEHALGSNPMQAESDRGVECQWRGDVLEVAYEVAWAPRDVRMDVEWTANLGGGRWQPLEAEAVDVGAGSTRYVAKLEGAQERAGGFVRLAAAETTPPPPGARWVWFEAEGSGGESGPELSNQAMTWVGPGAAVQRTVTIPAEGSYQLWVRKFWNPQAFRWRVGTSGPWQESREQALTDLLMLGGNAGRRVGWANVGTATLKAGTQPFRLEVLAGDANTTAYDCFLLTRDPFTPRGKLKPGDKVTIEQPGWFAFQPESDPFGFSPIDLRHLNEREAGEQGFVRIKGEDFVQESTGSAVRFWAVNVGMGFVASAKGEVDTFARAMAKRGVNLVRVHGPIYESSGANFGRVDTNRVAQLQYFVRALKREGIYTSLSIYFPLWVRLGEENPAFPGYVGGKHPFALLYFNPAFQALYREWWRSLLTTPNPHTGLALKDDPAVAFAEMVNEDSTLFWTFNPEAGASSNVPEPQRATLEQRFGDWLLKRYPGRSLAQIRSEVWSGRSSPQDNFGAGRVGFRGLWNVFNDRGRRDQDTARFLTELMLQFHRETYAFLKEEVGYRGLVYASNWKTASDKYLDPLDKYANSAADFYDRHGYFGGVHDGANASWNVEMNQSYDDRSALRFRTPDGTGDDFGNPLFDLIYQGRPSVITEVNWPLPNRYRADMVLLGAAYGALQGTDAVFWFAAGSPTWDGLPGKFSIQSPAVLGQFPAAALIYRRGLVQTAPRVVDLELGLEDLYALKGTPLPAPQNFDQLRGDDIPPEVTLTNVSAVDSLAFLVGRVGVDILENRAPQSKVVDLSAYIDRAGKRVRSMTGELAWDWGRGLMTVNAPAAQGVTGFLKAAGPVELADVVMESSLEYGTLLVVALDGRPIATAERLLLQVASEEQPHQWATDKTEGKRRITNRGTVPLMVREFAGEVRMKRADAAALTVTRLDFSGYRAGATQSVGAGIVLTSDVAYYLIER